MTANEARQKAESFNLIKNDIVYKKLQEAIQDEASKGRYYVIVNLPSFLLRTEIAVLHIISRLKNDQTRQFKL